VRYNVVVDGRTLEVEVLPDMINEEDDSPQFPGAVKASLAGAVVKLLVEPGATVKENEPVLVLEAMKMETQVPAPKAGTIGAIHVAVGDAIRSGQALFSMAEE
jgi:biotin carboxyl carrier protein